MTSPKALQAPRPNAPQHGNRSPEPGRRVGITPEIYRLPEVVAICGLSRSTVYAMIDRGEVPRLVQLGSLAVGWRHTDIEAWLAGRPTA